MEECWRIYKIGIVVKRSFSKRINLLKVNEYIKYCEFKFLCSLSFLFCIDIASAQSPARGDIEYIRKVFTQINSQKDLKKITVENEDLTDEVPDGGISLVGFFKDKSLLKIEEWAGLSYGTVQIEYYFDKDGLIFVYVTERHFRQSGDSLNHSKIDLKFEGRYYFKNALLIHKITTGIGFWNDSNDGVQSLLLDSKNYLKLLYSKIN
jgi:hypothetical protein